MKMADSSNSGPSVFTLSSVIRGHHVYKVIWAPFVGEGLLLKTEDTNEHDRHAVAIVKDDQAVVGHMPRFLLPVSWFLSREVEL